MKRPFKAFALVGLFAALTFAAAGCGGGGDEEGGGATTGGGGGAVTALPSSFCSEVFYEGEGEPEFIIASDLPLQGAGRAQTQEMVEAIKWAIQSRNFKAGDHNIGYQSCDDSTAQTGGWDSAKCASNARAYAGNQGVIGVVGTFNSGCAKIEVPILNRANPGPLAIVSPANTGVGLTKAGKQFGAEPGEPDKYYPTGTRNYARVVANDSIQGPADAVWAQELGLKKVFVLNDKQTYGYGVAFTFRAAAQKLGIEIAGFQGWDAKQSSYEALANTIKQSGADGIFLGGIICNNGAKLIKDLKAGTDATLIAPDGFSDPASNGPTFDGSWVSVAGASPESLKGEGKTFVDEFGAQIGATPNPYSQYGAQAMLVVLDAIAKSDGSRGSVASNLFGLKVTNGILGTFTLNDEGDTSLNPITIYQQKGGKLVPKKTITPPSNLTT